MVCQIHFEFDASFVLACQIHFEFDDFTMFVLNYYMISLSGGEDTRCAIQTEQCIIPKDHTLTGEMKKKRVWVSHG